MRSRTRVALVSIALLAILDSRAAFAQVTRTWVSGVGDDVNPCSRTAPCKTFAGAISKTAAGGEIDVLDPGGFGAVTITKAISIEADGVIAGILVAGTNGIVVQAGANDNVILRGLTFEGTGSGLAGVKFNSGHALIIENCFINNFVQNGIDFEPTGASLLNVKNTVITNNVGGVLIKPVTGGSADASLEHVRSENNSVYGFRIEAASTVSAKSCVADLNKSNGFLAVGSTGPSVLNLDDCASFANGQGGTGSGVQASGSQAIVRISNTAVSNNPTGLSAVSGGSLLSFRNNSVGGNIVDGTSTGTVTPE
jgi:hypothetical protein